MNRIRVRILLGAGTKFLPVNSIGYIDGYCTCNDVDYAYVVGDWKIEPVLLNCLEVLHDGEEYVEESFVIDKTFSIDPKDILKIELVDTTEKVGVKVTHKTGHYFSGKSIPYETTFGQLSHISSHYRNIYKELIKAFNLWKS